MKKNLLGLLLGVGIIALAPMSAKAANGVEINDTSVSVAYQGIANVAVSYTGSFNDLQVLVGDGSVVIYKLTDNGNGSATLSLAGIDYGSTNVAIYKASDMSAVDYLEVKSGLTSGYEIKSYYSGTDITTVYNDCVIKYNFTLNGSNNAKASVTGLLLTRENGLDRLNVMVDIVNDNSSFKGLSKYTASFYDKNGNLIKSQDSYVRSDLDLSTYNIYWYIPTDCVKIVID